VTRKRFDLPQPSLYPDFVMRAAEMPLAMFSLPLAMFSISCAQSG
jgi:hypothetical protein